MLAVLEHQEHHLPPPPYGHVQQADAAGVGDPLQELDLPQRRERKPVLLLVVQDYLWGAGGTQTVVGGGGVGRGYSCVLLPRALPSLSGVLCMDPEKHFGFYRAREAF